MLKSCGRISSIKTRRCLRQALSIPFFPCPHSPAAAALGSGSSPRHLPPPGGTLSVPPPSCHQQPRQSPSRLNLADCSPRSNASAHWKGGWEPSRGRGGGLGRDPDSAGPKRNRDPGQADGFSSLRPISTQITVVPNCPILP